MKIYGKLVLNFGRYFMNVPCDLDSKLSKALYGRRYSALKKYFMGILALIGLFACGPEASPFLHDAAKIGHVEQVRTLLENGVGIDSKDGFQRTALHWAVNRGHRGVAQLLIEKGANVNARDRDAFTPLHLATQLVYTGMARMLIEQGAELNAKENSWGKTPLHFVAQHGPDGMAQMLIEKGAQVTVRDNLQLTPLHYAALSGQEGIAQLLLDAGADANAKGEDPFTRDPGTTPLKLATTPSMRELLEKHTTK